MTSTRGLELRHFFEIDGLRAFAVVAVLMYHVSQQSVLPGGYVGVDVFFALSGYLITAILVAEQEATGAISLRQFYKRRAFRIAPALLTMVAIAAVCIVALRSTGHADGESYLAPVFAIASVMNWVRAFGKSGGSLGHTWSLSIEEQFYLLWPTILVLLGRWRLSRYRIATIILIVAISVVAWRIILWKLGASPDRLYNGLDTRAESLLAGAVLALVGPGNVPKVMQKTAFVPAFAIAAIACFAPPLGAPIMMTLGYSAVPLLTVWLIAALVSGVGGPVRAILASSAAVWVGKRSYSLYLWHYPIIFMGGEAIPASRFSPLAWLLLAAASFLAADLSYRFIERPFLRAKDRVPRPSLPLARA